MASPRRRHHGKSPRRHHHKKTSSDVPPANDVDNILQEYGTIKDGGETEGNMLQAALAVSKTNAKRQRRKLAEEYAKDHREAAKYRAQAVALAPEERQDRELNAYNQLRNVHKLNNHVDVNSLKLYKDHQTEEVYVEEFVPPIENAVAVVTEAFTLAFGGRDVLLNFFAQNITEFNNNYVKHLEFSLRKSFYNRKVKMERRLEALWRYCNTLLDLQRGDLRHNIDHAIAGYKLIIEHPIAVKLPFTEQAVKNSIKIAQSTRLTLIGERIMESANSLSFGNGTLADLDGIDNNNDVNLDWRDFVYPGCTITAPPLRVKQLRYVAPPAEITQPFLPQATEPVPDQVYFNSPLQAAGVADITDFTAWEKKEDMTSALAPRIDNLSTIQPANGSAPEVSLLQPTPPAMHIAEAEPTSDNAAIAPVVSLPLPYLSQPGPEMSLSVVQPDATSVAPPMFEVAASPIQNSGHSELAEVQQQALAADDPLRLVQTGQLVSVAGFLQPPAPQYGGDTSSASDTSADEAEPLVSDGVSSPFAVNTSGDGAEEKKRHKHKKHKKSSRHEDNDSGAADQAGGEPLDEKDQKKRKHKKKHRQEAEGEDVAPLMAAAAGSASIQPVVMPETPPAEVVREKKSKKRDETPEERHQRHKEERRARRAARAAAEAAGIPVADDADQDEH